MGRRFQLVIPLLLQLLYSGAADWDWDPDNTPDLFVTANTFDLIGFVGKGVTMYATVRGDPRPTADDITWIKMQGNMPEERVQITYDLATNESRLRINDLEYADEGTYYCTASINGVSKSVSMTLRVVVEPEIFRVTGLMSFKAVGQSVVLSVTVNGSPIPTAEDITWAKMDERSIPMPLTHDRFELNNGNKELTITDLQISDEGWYKCLVKTDEGKAEAPFVLYVLGMRSIDETAVGVVGNSVSMTCKATYVKHVFPSTPTVINWYRYEAPDTPLTGLTQTEDSGTTTATSVLTLSDLDWSDEGEYFCTSSYTGFPDNSIYNATLSIRGLSSISGPEVEGVLGNQLTMTCVARGDIQATITWAHNDTSIRVGVTTETTYSAPFTTSVLTVGSLTLSDQGVYLCSVEFDQQTSTVSQSTQLNLNYVLKTLGAPLGVEENAVTITCSVIGNIAPDSWSWQDANSTDSSQWGTSQTSLDKKESSVHWTVDRFDTGKYTCSAEYGVRGTSSGEVDLTVQYVKTSPSDQTVVYGADATLTCITNLAPDAFKWHKDTSHLDTAVTQNPDPTTSHLLLSPVEFEHAGQYSCEAVFSGKSADSLAATFFVRGFEVHPEDTTTVNMTSATLSCQAIGDTAAQLTWYHGNTELEHGPTVSISTQAMGFKSSSYLTISLLSATTSDYHCAAHYSAGDVTVTSSSASIRVLGVDSAPVDSTGVVGNSVTLECEPTEQTGTITWLHNGTDITGTSSITVLGGVSQLLLNNVAWTTAGVYQCVVDYSDYDPPTYAAEPATLSIRGVTQSPESVITEEGSDITLTCLTTGPPSPSITWYKAGNQALGQGQLLNDYKSLLILSSVDLTTTADYKCVADYGDLGTHKSESATVIVRGIESDPVATTAVKTNTARFTCVIRGDKAPSFITWSRDDTPVDMTTASVATTTVGVDTTTVLTLEGVESAGKYKCSAVFETPNGEVVSESADLRVLEYTTDPQHTDTVLGYPLTLTCEVDDNPSSLIFYHNDTELVTGVTTDNNLATLKVEEVELAAAGLYHCGAVYAPSLQTLGGSLNSSVAMVTVSSFIYEPTDVYVKAGSSAEMSCRTTGHIQPTFSWKAGPVVTNDGTITVAKWDTVELEDEGQYWCEAQFGETGTLTSSSATLYVRAIKRPPTDRMAVLGHDAALTCEVHGQGLTSITWLTEAGEEVKVETVALDTTLATSVLELSDVTENENYSCKASFSDPADEIVSGLALVYVNQISSVTSSVTLVSGQSATLTCKADQDPSFSWHYTGTGQVISQNILNSPGSSELVLPGVTTNTSVECHVTYPETAGYTLGGTLTSDPVLVIVNDISVHPKNRTVVIGYSTTLHCAGNNDPAISWYKDNTLVSDTSPLVLESVQTTDQTSYYCSLAWDQGSLSTDKVRVTVLDMVVQPMSGIAVTGGTTSASCSAPAPATFVWYKNDEEVDPASDSRYTITSSTRTLSHTLLTISNATTDTDGSYTCEAVYQPDLSTEFTGGRVRSSPATLTVYRILGHPEDKFVLLDKDITLSCQLNDSATITWYHNDSPIGPGVTSIQDDTITSELALSNVEWEDAGYYYCEGNYDQGTVTSTPAKVFVRGIWTAPESVSVVLGYPASFQCVSRGEAEIAWSWGDVELESTSSNYSDSNWLTIATLKIDTVSVRDPALVTCHVDYISPDPMFISAEAVSITVYSVTTDPENTIGIKTNNSTLSCVASGNPTITWHKEGTGLLDLKTESTESDGSVTSQLFLTDIKMSDVGQYKCVADYGGLGEHTSQTATLTVYELTKEPVAQAIESGKEGVFSCESNGVPDSVNWYKDDEIITDSTNIRTESTTSTLTLPSLEFSDKGNYKCEFLFPQGRISSSQAYLSVRGFYLEPTDSVAIQDNSVSFTCIVHGESEAAISWKNGESPLESLVSTGLVTIDTTYSDPNTTSLLTLKSLKHDVYHDASITCTAEFSSPALSATSRVGKLTVLRILEPPVDTSAVDTLTVTLSCKIDNSGVISWYNGTELMEGESSETLTLDPVTAVDQGQYHCRATYPAVGQFVYGGVTRSEEITLTVHRFTTLPETTHVTLGSATSLKCEGSGQPVIVWFKGTEEVQKGSSTELVLSDVTFPDDDQYSCKLEYPQGVISSDIVDIHVRGVSTSPSRGTAVLGQSVLFQCIATGDIQPTFSWTRNGGDITGESEDVFESPLTTTTFSYSGVVESDTTAEFRCTANFEGQTHQSQPASVTVLKVTTSPVAVYGVVGGAASLSCVAAGDPAPSSFTWLRDGEEVEVEDTVTFPSASDAQSKITVSDLAREDDGDYTCVPDYPPDLDNNFLGGNTTSSPGKLSVIGLTEPPVQTIVKVGDTATFTCKADAVPVPTLSWFKSGSTITSGVSSPKTVGDEVVSYLTINNVGDIDVAPYSCKADYPSLGSHLSEDAYLRFRGIEEPPLVTPAVIGQSGELNCTARGEAEAELKWLANGTEITPSDDYSIFTASNFDPAKQQDLIDTRTILTVSTVLLPVSYLEITCSATWTSLDGQDSVVLSEPVKFDPLYVYKSPADTIAVRYTMVELSCSATRSPLIRWDRSGRTYGVGIIDIDGEERTHSTLRIGNVTEADQGDIWCVAQYDGGMHDSDKAQLTVVGITSEPQTATLTQRGLSVQFTCVVDRYPENTVSWYRGEDKIQDYDNRKDMTKEEKDLFVEYTLSVSSVTEEDIGAYHCKVEYPQGAQISQPAYLQILEPAQITLIVATGGEKAGESMELLCQASGVPTPTITWRRSGKEFPSDETSSIVTVYNEPGSSLVLINMTSEEDQGIYSCVASNGVGDPVIMETEIVLEAAVKVVTVASASSLLVFIIAVCTAVMLFALYRRRKRKNTLHPEEKVPPTTPVEETEPDLENHVYDNEASIFGEVKSCEDDDLDYESGIECDDDIPTVEPPDDNPALFLMPDRTSKELPPLNRVPSASLSENPIFSVPTASHRNNQLPSLGKTGNLPPLPSSIYENEFNLNSDTSDFSQKAGLIDDDEKTIGLIPNLFNEAQDSSSPCPSGYMSGTDLTSSGGLPVVDERREPMRRLSLLARENVNSESPDPHVPTNLD